MGRRAESVIISIHYHACIMPQALYVESQYLLSHLAR
jgi:hypothetical protein